MARIKISLPGSMPFTTEIPVRITDLNYAGHLGNDSLLTILHEARERFLISLGYSEMDVEGHIIYMSDAAVEYKSEGFYGMTLLISVGAAEFHRTGCDIFYNVVNIETGKVIARAKTGVVFVQRESRKMTSIPLAFLQKHEAGG